MEDIVAIKCLNGLEKRFLQCCHQINLVDQKLDALQVRYQCVTQVNRRRAVYPLRLQIATMEGMRNLLNQYAKNKALEMAELRRLYFDEDVHAADYVEIPEDEAIKVNVD